MLRPARHRWRKVALVLLCLPGLALAGCGQSTPTAQTTPALSTTPLIGSTTGVAPVYTPPDSSWLRMPIALMRATLAMPGDWQAKDRDDTHVSLRPPTSAPDHPSPAIFVTMLAGAKLDAVLPPSSAGTAQSIDVSGRRGWQADDPPYLPPYSRYVAVQLLAGVLYLQAYRGPGVDLTPFLTGVLSTLAATP
jgi:hypothetical protein